MSDSNDNPRSWGPVIANVSFLILTAALMCGVVYLLRNVLHAIILGVLFAVILMPLHARVQRIVRRITLRVRSVRKGKVHITPSYIHRLDGTVSWISSLLSVILVFFFITIPLTFFVVSLAKQGRTTIPSAKHWVEEEIPRKTQELVEKYGENRIVKEVIALLPSSDTTAEHDESLDDVSASPTDDAHSAETDTSLSEKISDATVTIVKNALQFLWHASLKILSRTWLTVFNFFIMLFVMYHIFHDGKHIGHYLKRISPLGEQEQQKVVQRIREVSRAIFFSIFGTACVQGLLSMLFFFIVGIPALFWGFLLGLCSIIPFVGTGLIWVPATVYLFMTGHVWKALFILVTCGGITSNIDSIIRPFLMKQGGKTGMSYLVLFFSILGGLQTFGLVGIIYGPLIMGMCSICLLIFSTRFKKQ